MTSQTRMLKAAIGVMSILILAGLVLFVVLLAGRLKPAVPLKATVMLDPADQVISLSNARDALALLVRHSNGSQSILFLDAKTGAAKGQIEFTEKNNSGR